MSKTKFSNPTPKKRMALYARVSTQEQTKGNYPSCESQIEELEAFCKAEGWDVQEAVKDEGVSAGSLKRSGLTRLRWLVETEQIDGILCTWYDRLTRSRDFYTLDKEFKTHNVAFITLHDPTDRHTASGRFLETMLVAAKTYEREQTGEKVRTKHRMRSEKGMWNGGHVPFGFLRDPQSHGLQPDPEKVAVVRQIFQIYTETRSDFLVRDWLKQRQIPAPQGNRVWSVSTIRYLLTNRLFVGEIEINKATKGHDESSDTDAYRIVKATFEPIVPKDLWNLAQTLRLQKADEYPNNPGAIRNQGRSYTWCKDQRVYPLQGLLHCAVCGSLMTPHYVFHKAGPGRRKDSFINHYICTKHRKYGTDCDHRNRVLARTAENWVLERVKDLAQSPQVLERSLEHALRKSDASLQPLQAVLAQTRSGLLETEKQIETLMNTLSVGAVTPALLQLVNERASELKTQRDTLRVEQRRLTGQLAHLERKPEAVTLRRVLSNFLLVAEKAEPKELQRLLHLMVRRLTWNSNGEQSLRLYNLAGADKRPSGDGDNPAGGRISGAEKQKMPNLSSPEKGENWFDISMWNDSSNWIRTSNPPINSRMLHR